MQVPEIKIIIASGPVIVEDGRVLVNQHGDTTFWKFCGGKVENFNENLSDAAVREVKEEMGIDVDILNLTPFLTYAHKDFPPKDRVDVILVHFLAKRVGDINPGADIRKWEWLDIANLPPDDDLAPNIKPTLKHFGFLK